MQGYDPKKLGPERLLLFPTSATQTTRTSFGFFSKATVIVQTADVRMHPMALGGTTRDAIITASTG